MVLCALQMRQQQQELPVGQLLVLVDLVVNSLTTCNQVQRWPMHYPLMPGQTKSTIINSCMRHYDTMSSECDWILLSLNAVFKQCDKACACIQLGSSFW